jgi:hypothetical protein
MQGLVNYTYDYIDRLIGTALIKHMKPESMSKSAYQVFRLQTRIFAYDGLLDELFAEASITSNT